MAKAKRAKFTKYQATGATTTHKHVRYVTKTDGRLKMSTSFVTIKQGQQSTDLKASTSSFSDDELLQRVDEILLNAEGLDPAYVEHLAEINVEPARHPRGPAIRPLQVWFPKRETFLAEIMRHEGRGESVLTTCAECRAGEPEFECQDCHGRQLLCQQCIVQGHLTNPFHRIRKWNGLFFERVSLQQLGLRIQLGHPPGVACPNPAPCTGDSFVIIDIHMIHNVNLDFCACGASLQSKTVQLLRSRFYPATVDNPRTAVTFRTLELFELLSYVSKVSVFEFYQSLSRLTDNTGINVPKDRYEAFLVVIREWRYLRLMKRMGRGHDPKGLAVTKLGECAVLCPACPQPGRNLPSDWESTSEEKRWLYTLLLGIDANFRLKRKNVSNDAADPDLNEGCAYFVEEKEYKKYLSEYKAEKEPKTTCSRHDAVRLSETNPSNEHASTGTGTVECSRHDMKRPNAVGDLQKGERYCNMDYLFYKGLVGSEIMTLVVSYDIACQWSINLRRRMDNIDSSFHIFSGGVNIRYLVPKFHLPAHVAACRTRYAFNYTKGVGRTDGEAPEPGWAEVNPLAPSTKEMGPGSRHDTLDAHFGDYNWRKFVGMGSSLLRKMKAATLDMHDHVVGHEEYQRSLPKASVAQWILDVETWEKDPSTPNPFEVKVTTPTQAAIRRNLLEAETRDLAAGNDFTLDADISPASLISLGLDLEAEQRALKVEGTKIWLHSQDRQVIRFQVRSNVLQRKINAWKHKQQTYIPRVTVLHRLWLEKAQPCPPYEVPLWLPSQIGTKVVFDLRLAQIEWALRVGQAYESLDELRSNLQVRSHLYRIKDRFVRGQAANTRARNTINGIQARIDASAEGYRAARVALVSLAPLLGKTGWEEQLQPLNDVDKREMAEGEEGVSEGRRSLSWIWKTIGVVGAKEDQILHDSLRVEWCKSRARAMHFTEEVELLEEEMARVLRYLEWQEGWWRARGLCLGWEGIPEANTEGLRAYAERQAALRRSLREHFTTLWKDVPFYIRLAREAISYVRVDDPVPVQ